jgi:hypothetical protein
MFIARWYATASASMGWRDSYHVTYFLCGLRYATIELFSVRGPCPEQVAAGTYGGVARHTEVLVTLIIISRYLTGQYFTSGQNHFLLHSFEFTLYLSYYNLLLHSLSY